jgi:D-alanyl-D-alanine carboxypeptidase
VRLRLGALAVVAGAAGVAAVVAIGRGDDSTSLEEAAAEAVASGFPAVIVRLRDGDELTVLARGAADPQTRFRVGSITKTFVAALTLRLAKDGALSLDDTVDRHAVGLLPDANRITVRDLLAHTSGLADHTALPGIREGRATARAAIDAVSVHDRLPGYHYSSTNYLVLGLVLEAVASQPLSALLRSHVFEPYGLADTTFEPGRVRGRYLHGHERAVRDGVATGRYRDTDARRVGTSWAAAAAVSSAADLDRFFTRLLATPLGRRMLPPDGARYGLGLAAFDTECGRVVGHTGNVLGTVSVVWTRGDRVLVAVTNAYPLTPSQETVFGALLTRAFCG